MQTSSNVQHGSKITCIHVISGMAGHLFISALFHDSWIFKTSCFQWPQIVILICPTTSSLHTSQKWPIYTSMIKQKNKDNI